MGLPSFWAALPLLRGLALQQLKEFLRDSPACGVVRFVKRQAKSPAGKAKTMKLLNKIVLVAACAALAGLPHRASAQPRAVGDDGIAASPRIRQMLNDRNGAPGASSVAVASACCAATSEDGIAASPRLRQFLDERRTMAGTPSTSVASVGYRPAGEDGIAASPKLRQQLNERGAELQFMVAPVK